MLERKDMVTELLALAFLDPQHAPSSETTWDIYHRVLARLDRSTFRAAVVRHAETCKWFPKPSEILDHAQRVLEERGALPDDAGRAWARVEQASRRWSPYGWTPPWAGDTLIERALDGIGGMRTLALAEAEQIGYLRHDFKQAYTRYRERGLTADQCWLSRALPEGDHASGGRDAVGVLQGQAGREAQGLAAGDDGGWAAAGSDGLPGLLAGAERRLSGVRGQR